MQATLITAFLVSALLGSVTPIYRGGGRGGVGGRGGGRGGYGGRDVQAGSAETVFDLIFETLKTANNGITSSELTSAARRIINDSDALAGDVSAEEVDNLIKEIATSISSTSIISSIFDDDLNFDAKVINDALELWKGLAQKGRELAESKKPLGHILAAISKTAKAIEAVVKDIVEIVNYKDSNNQNKNVDGESSKEVLLISEDSKDNEASQTISDKPEKRNVRVCLEWQWIFGRGRVCVRFG